ncbi:carbohydrate ABC transporter permease [Brachybacterium sp. FME24]|uniref:carbohydrate ABC transporter permease n=1 Tax=Brachybacterium sp. FME24 TaxID=2742605 RepID=UPI001D0331C9|nr:carbohydrate ABC transporter permease [Brachybacterium sp. FME24]
MTALRERPTTPMSHSHPAPTPTPAPQARARRNQRPQKIGIHVALLVCALFPALPILWMASTSLKPNGQVFAWPPKLITSAMNLDSYVAIFADGEKLRFFLNSYIVAGSVTVLTLLASVLAAYALSRYDFPFKRALNVVIISVQAVPPITLLIPYFGLVVTLGLYDTYGGLILTYMVFTLPYAIIMMTGYFNTLPRELDEAVMVDGAGPLTVLFRILLPIAVPGLVSVGVYTFMIAWNEYLFALTLTRTNEMRTVPIGIQLLMGQHSYDWSQIMAMSILGSIPILVLFTFFQRYFLSGMSAGAVKA